MRLVRKDNQSAPKIVIVISGGNLQGISGSKNVPELDIVVIDHDNMEAEGIDRDRADELQDAALADCPKGLGFDDHSSVKLEGDPSVWEFTLPGFDGSTDETDDKVLWISGTFDDLKTAVGFDFATRFIEISVEVDDPAIDFHLPRDTDKLLKRLLQEVPA